MFDLNSNVLSSIPIGISNIRAEPHPSWKYLYGISNYEYLVKFNIQGNIPEVVYSTLDMAFGYKCWVSEDGNRIITSNKKVLSINPDTTGYDITSISEIGCLLEYRTTLQLVQNSQKNEFYFLETLHPYYSDPRNLLVLNNNLDFKNEISPEGFHYIEPDGGYAIAQAEIQFVFYDGSGQNVILITRPVLSTHILEDAIEIIQ
nr:hypothetical protein [Bacteroidota bacterium]